MDVHIDVSLKRQFFEFSIFQSSDTKAECISLRQIDRWLKQAGILDMNKITTTYTGMLFSEFGSTSMDYQSFLNFLEKLIEEKGENPDDIFKKLVKCGKPNIEEFCGDVPEI
ncbi:hypothetical protein HHI36_018389 [Cryptolaemus montrouzieri]|uniref:Uncharacterized protein n=1 Tax=Cryptolaemus montrouzieri TaxID=559131 RepID=A0ABD2P076_9CUCU